MHASPPAPAPVAGLPPEPAGTRIEALDVLRGFALLGILVMNVPGFSHSLFTPPQVPASLVEAAIAWLREALFAGKFNLLFGTLFGIGFTLQLARLEAQRPGNALRVYVRRLLALLAIGLAHATLVWSGDVLVVYAVLGFLLLAVRHLPDRSVLVLIAACLVFPALSEALRPMVVSADTETLAVFQYEAFRSADDAAFGRGTLMDAARETWRIFTWSYTTPLGLFSYGTFYVQMATGILFGLFAGRRQWPRRLGDLGRPIRRAQRLALGAVLVCGAGWLAFGGTEGAAGAGPFSTFMATLARTLGRAALSGLYALTLLRLLERARWRAWLRPLALAGRMPLSNYLLQTALCSAIFYGWGLGYWNRLAPSQEVLLAFALFGVVQLPLSAWWISRFGRGPAEAVWRRLTYGKAATRTKE